MDHGRDTLDEEDRIARTASYLSTKELFLDQTYSDRESVWSAKRKVGARRLAWMNQWHIKSGLSERMTKFKFRVGKASS